MKFKNFDTEDVLGPNDLEQAYINASGFFANDLEDLDRLHYFSRLTYTCKIGVGRYTSEQGDSFKYFLPLDKLKRRKYFCDFKTEPTEKDINYRPCKNLIELMDLLDEEEHGSCLVGTTICIKHKLKTRMIESSIITSVKRDCDGNWLLYLGDKFHSLVELFNHYDILLKGGYQPFGVKVDE